MKSYMWELQGNYGYGWECLTAEEIFQEIKERLKEYRENEGGNYRIRRVKNEEISSIT